jgi:hypothetical protein
MLEVMGLLEWQGAMAEEVEGVQALLELVIMQSQALVV